MLDFFKKLRVFSFVYSFYLTFAILSLGLVSSYAVTINGSGSSFIFPLMSRWAFVYHNLTGEKINYQSVGSAAGVVQNARTITDFSAHDFSFYFMKIEGINPTTYREFALVKGAIIPVINIPTIKGKDLHISGDILAKIYLNKIKFWDDKAIVSINAKLHLPHKKIITVHRADGSGTTLNFVKYLFKESKLWRTHYLQPEENINWLGGLGGKGNSGIASLIQQIPYSIGYVEYSFALGSNLPFATIIKNGKIFLPNAKDWPITTTSYMSFKKTLPKYKQKIILDFLKWLNTTKAKNIAKSLYYIPIDIDVDQKNIISK